MISHNHLDFDIKLQIDLVAAGIKKAGGVGLFADYMGVTRHTVSRWASGKHIMRADYILELMRWLRKLKSNGSVKKMTDG